MYPDSNKILIQHDYTSSKTFQKTGRWMLVITLLILKTKFSRVFSVQKPNKYADFLILHIDTRRRSSVPYSDLQTNMSFHGCSPEADNKYKVRV